MQRLRLWVRAFFGFSRMETNAFLLLIPLVMLILFSSSLYRLMADPQPLPDFDRTDSLFAWLDTQHQLKSNQPTDTVPLHAFNPNTATAEELVQLHAGEGVARRIVRYREKGGRFYRKEDLLKIFGIDTTWYKMVSPYIKIANQPSKPGTQRTRKQISREDINAADTAQLMDVYGIGPVLARRILVFRERLGGFVNIQQLREVYGLDSIVVGRLISRFQVNIDSKPRLIDINEATIDALSQHPYISRKQAQALVAYRVQHGRLDSIGQLRAIQSLDNSWLDRIKPYLQIPSEAPDPK